MSTDAHTDSILTSLYEKLSQLGAKVKKYSVFDISVGTGADPGVLAVSAQS